MGYLVVLEHCFGLIEETAILEGGDQVPDGLPLDANVGTEDVSPTVSMQGTTTIIRPCNSEEGLLNSRTSTTTRAVLPWQRVYHHPLYGIDGTMNCSCGLSSPFAV
jgi:hypothetical protein